MMTTWIKSTFDFPKRIAYGMILDEFVHKSVSAVAEEHPEAMEAYLQALLPYCAQGKYAGASLHGIHFDLQRCVWLVLFSHPALPIRALRGTPLFYVDLEITPADLTYITLHDLPPAAQAAIRASLAQGLPAMIDSPLASQ